MSTKPRLVKGHSVVASLMEQFVQEKRACGYHYNDRAYILRSLDAFLCQQGLAKCELPRSLSGRWLMRRLHESTNSQLHRISTVRQFAMYMCRLGYRADVPGRTLASKPNTHFSPRVLTHAEIQQLFAAVDRLDPVAQTPLRHVVMPEVFRLLYGCGFRINEVLRLRVADVDLVHGVLTVRAGKFGKDRLVPPALPLVVRLKKYATKLGPRPANAYFFPSTRRDRWSHSGVYRIYRELLQRCRISHRGRGKGPRLHDLRHTFAVHNLLQWYRSGADLDAKLPVLATYLGHVSLDGTQQYLHLTAEVFPEVIVRSNETFGDIIPRGRLS